MNDRADTIAAMIEAGMTPEEAEDTQRVAEARAAQKRQSTVNLTLTIFTDGGVPDDMTAHVVAAQAAYAIQTSLAQIGCRAEVTGKVSSAFIVRGERIA